MKLTSVFAASLLIAVVLIECCEAADLKPVKPLLEWNKGEHFFRLNGTQRLVLGRNPVAVTPDAFEEHFKNAAEAGESFVRIHFCFMPLDEKPGEIHLGIPLHALCDIDCRHLVSLVREARDPAVRAARIADIIDHLRNSK